MKLKNYLIALMALFTTMLNAQSSFLDPSFSGGVVLSSFAYPYNYGRDVAIQSDGKIVVAGGQDNRYILIRYNTNGKRDSTFGGTGVVGSIFPIGNGSNYFKLVIQSDGKLLAAGSTDFSTPNNPQLIIARYHSNGDLDSTFGTNGAAFHFSGQVPKGLAVLSDGKILVCTDWGNNYCVQKFTATGAIDSTFGVNGKTLAKPSTANDNTPRCMAVQADGKIVVGGGFTGSSITHGDVGLIRFNTNGSVDSTFGTNGVVTLDIDSVNNFVIELAIQPDGKIIAGGYFQGIYTGVLGKDFALLRFNSNGTRDMAFGTNGKTTYNLISDSVTLSRGTFTDMLLQPDGKIIAGGQNQGDFMLLRYNSNGTFDNTFGNGGRMVGNMGPANTDELKALALQTDGKVVATGYTNNGSTHQVATARFLPIAGSVGVLDFADSNIDLLIYPNPVRDNATLQYTLLNQENITVSLLNANGQLVQSILNQTQNAGEHTLKIDLNPTLPAGNYFVVVSNGNSKSTIQLVKL